MDSRYHGYIRVDVASAPLRAGLRILDSVQKSDATRSTLAPFVIENGKPGPRRLQAESGRR